MYKPPQPASRYIPVIVTLNSQVWIKACLLQEGGKDGPKLFSSSVDLGPEAPVQVCIGQYQSGGTTPLSLPSDVQVALPFPGGTILRGFQDIEFKNTCYKTDMWMVIDKVAIINLQVGRIKQILVTPNDSIYLVLEVHTAESSWCGYYVIKTQETSRVINIKDLPDYFPLPSYLVNGKNCIVLKHSTIFM